jgi:uncharacterized protein YbjT (DUF2867 family)
MILVTGASGNVGKAAADWLESRGVPYRAAVRNPGKSNLAAGRAVRFDWSDPTTWEPALDGVSAMVLIRPPAIADVESTLNRFVTLAQERGCRNVSFLSVVGVEEKSWVPHRKVEHHLRRSGLSWTFLRAGFFAQNLMDSYLPDIRQGEIRVPAARGNVAWVDARDLGEAAAKVLLDGIWDQRTPILTGPESIDFHQTCEILSHTLGRSIRYVPCSGLGYFVHLRRFHRLPLIQCAVQTALHLGLRRGEAAGVSDDLRAIVGRTPRGMTDFVVDHKDRFV